MIFGIQDELMPIWGKPPCGVFNAILHSKEMKPDANGFDRQAGGGDGRSGLLGRKVCSLLGNVGAEILVKGGLVTVRKRRSSSCMPIIARIWCCIWPPRSASAQHGQSGPLLLRQQVDGYLIEHARRNGIDEFVGRAICATSSARSPRTSGMDIRKDQRPLRRGEKGGHGHVDGYRDSMDSMVSTSCR